MNLRRRLTVPKKIGKTLLAGPSDPVRHVATSEITSRMKTRDGRFSKKTAMNGTVGLLEIAGTPTIENGANGFG